MNTPESITPIAAAEESARNFTQYRLAVAAVSKAQETIAMSAADEVSSTLDDHRKSLAAWHVRWWNENELPDREEHLEFVVAKSEREYQKNNAAYYTAAIALAMLDGVDLR